MPHKYEVLSQHTMLPFLLLSTKVKYTLTTSVVNSNHDRD